MRTLIVEDSRLAREGLARMLQSHAEIELVGMASDADSALRLLRELRPELVLLDIGLPGGTGYSVLEQLDFSPKIIVTTADPEQALRAFDFDAVDFLLKPIRPERLARALDKLSTDAAPVSTTLGPDDRILLKDGERCHLIAVRDMRLLASAQSHVRVWFGNQQAVVRKTLQHVAARLPPQLFFQANRQTVVNLQAVRAIDETAGGGYLLTLDDGQRLDISRRQAAVLKERMSL